MPKRADRAAIARLKAIGEPNTKIADQLGLDHSTVWRQLQSPRVQQMIMQERAALIMQTGGRLMRGLEIAVDTVIDGMQHDDWQIRLDSVRELRALLVAAGMGQSDAKQSAVGLVQIVNASGQAGITGDAAGSLADQIIGLAQHSRRALEQERALELDAGTPAGDHLGNEERPTPPGPPAGTFDGIPGVT